MFMIHSPQTMQLLADDPSRETGGESHGTVTFDHESDDVSKCRMIVASKDKLWTYVFNTRGLLVESFYEDDASRKAKADAEKKAAEDLKASQEHDRQLAKESADHELKTADDTTAKDVSWDNTLGQPHATPTPPNPFTPGKVNTTQSMGARV